MERLIGAEHGVTKRSSIPLLKTSTARIAQPDFRRPETPIVRAGTDTAEDAGGWSAHVAVGPRKDMGPQPLDISPNLIQL